MPGPLPKHPTGRQTERLNRCVSDCKLFNSLSSFLVGLHMTCHVPIAMSTADLFCAPRGLRALGSGVSNASKPL
jgi:hypothetical protein